MTKSTQGRIARRHMKKMDNGLAKNTQINSDGITRVLNWAHAPSPYVGSIGRLPAPVIPTDVGMNNLQVLGLLISINGFKPRVERWGFHSGPFGLSQPEAFLLIEMSTYFQGLVDGAGIAAESAGNLLQPELDSWANIFESVPVAVAVEKSDETPARTDGVVNADLTMGPGGEVLKLDAAPAEAAAE